MGYKRGDFGLSFDRTTSMTVQADARNLDINKMVQKIRNGQAVPMYGGQLFYGDVSNFKGLADAYEKISEVEELFGQFDPKLRELFDNDPVKFVDFMDNPDNLKKAEEIGLVNKKSDDVTPV